MCFYGYVHFKIKEKRNENDNKSGKLREARPSICVRAFRFHRLPPFGKVSATFLMVLLLTLLSLLCSPL